MLIFSLNKCKNYSVIPDSKNVTEYYFSKHFNAISGSSNQSHGILYKVTLFVCILHRYALRGWHIIEYFWSLSSRYSSSMELCHTLDIFYIFAKWTEKFVRNEIQYFLYRDARTNFEFLQTQINPGLSWTELQICRMAKFCGKFPFEIRPFSHPEKINMRRLKNPIKLRSWWREDIFTLSAKL